ncbi:MAG: ATP-binding protein [Slackia sp.]
MANALVHRCWDVRANIKVGMFADRIEITSPGGLPAGIRGALPRRRSFSGSQPNPCERFLSTGTYRTVRYGHPAHPGRIRP